MLRARGRSLLTATATAPPLHTRYAYTTTQRCAEATAISGSSCSGGGALPRPSCAVRLLHSSPRRMGWADALMRSVRGMWARGKEDTNADANTTHAQQQQQQSQPQSQQQAPTGHSDPSAARAQPAAGQTHQSATAAATANPSDESATALGTSAFTRSQRELGHSGSDDGATDVSLGTHSASQAAALADLLQQQGDGAAIEDAEAEGEGDEAGPDALAADADADADADDVDGAAEAAEAEAALARHDSLEERAPGPDENPLERVLHEEEADRGRELEDEIDDEGDAAAGADAVGASDFAAAVGAPVAAAATPAARSGSGTSVPSSSAGSSSRPRVRAPSRPSLSPRTGAVRFTSWRAQGPGVVRLAQQRMYSAAIASFNALWAAAPVDQRARVPLPVLEAHLSSLAALHCWEAILRWHGVSATAGARMRLYSSPLGLDLLLQACMRHPRAAPLVQVWAGLLRIDRRRSRRRWEEDLDLRRSKAADEGAATGSSAAAAVAASAAVPVQLVLTEKAANQLMKAALLSNDPALALDMWHCVVMGGRPRTPALAAEEALHRTAVSTAIAAAVAASGAGVSGAVGAALAPLYRPLNYRLHSQTAWGLVNFLLQRRQYSAGQAPPSPMLQLQLQPQSPHAASPNTIPNSNTDPSASAGHHSTAPLSSSAPASTPSRPNADAHVDLFRAFQIYLQTSFIESLQDQTLLFRILNTTLCAVLSPPPPTHSHSLRSQNQSQPSLSDGASGSGSGLGASPPVHLERSVAARLRQRNTWLALQVYKYVLHHNECIGRVDAAHSHAPNSAGLAAGGEAGREGGAGSKDTPWSYRGHRRYIQLEWDAHYRPLMQVCLLHLERERDAAPHPAPAAAVATATGATSTAASSAPHAGAGVGVGTTGGAPSSAPAFDASLWLDALLYDVRLSFPDYSALLLRPAGAATTARQRQREREEVEALETEEAAQNVEMALYVSSLALAPSPSTIVNTSASAAPSGWPRPLPPQTLLPNLPLRPLDEEMFLALAREWIRRDRRQRAQSRPPSQPQQQPALARLVSLYQSVPRLSRFDGLRSELVRMVLVHLADEGQGQSPGQSQGQGQGQGSGAVALSRATAPLLSEAKRLAQEWRSPEAVARRQARAGAGPGPDASKRAAWSEEFDDAAAAAAAEGPEDVESESAARDRWVAEHAPLHALSTAELFDPSTAPALLESMDVHAVSAKHPAPSARRLAPQHFPRAEICARPVLSMCLL